FGCRGAKLEWRDALVVETSLLCPNGHRWEITLDERDASSSMATACPICGLLCPPENLPTVVTPGGRSGPIEETVSEPSSLLTIPGYEVIGLLGQGGMGQVFKARHQKLGRLVALKVISARGQASQEQLNRFQIEAQALASLNHPHIVQIFEVHDYQGYPCFS